jgi:hypothetical protein
LQYSADTVTITAAHASCIEGKGRGVVVIKNKKTKGQREGHININKLGQKYLLVET